MAIPPTTHSDRESGKSLTRTGPSLTGLFEVFYRILPKGVPVLIGTAAAGAVILTASAVYLFLQAPRPPIGDIGLNLMTESIFFWIELILLVIGIRVYEKSWGKRDLYQVRQALKNAADSFDARRLEFAEKLDTSKQAGGYYDANMSDLNIGLGTIRGEFLRERYRDDSVTLLTHSIWDRVLRSLDMAVGKSYQGAEVAERLNRELKEEVHKHGPSSASAKQISVQLEVALESCFDSTNPREYDGFQTLTRATGTL